jgi:DNA-binding CsgD family transcriptional regulator/tetratricopeptide (TPR) repeat protein
VFSLGSNGAQISTVLGMFELVGRNAALDAAREHLQAAEQGNGRGVVIAGEAGIGKSAVLDAIAGQAIQRSMNVRRGSGQVSEQQSPFGLLRQLLTDDELIRPQSSAPQPFTAVANRVLGHLSAQSSEQPVVWIIDDLQWADESSAALLSFVARRLQADRVVLFFGVRTNTTLTEASAFHPISPPRNSPELNPALPNTVKADRTASSTAAAASMEQSIAPDVEPTTDSATNSATDNAVNATDNAVNATDNAVNATDNATDNAVNAVRGFPRIELTTLDETESVQLLIDSGCDAGIAREHYGLGGGLPLALVELAKQLKSKTLNHQLVAMQIPRHYADLVDTLTPEVFRVLSIVALDDQLRTVLRVVGTLNVDGPHLRSASSPVSGSSSNRQAGLGTFDADGPHLRSASSPVSGSASNRQAGLGTFDADGPHLRSASSPVSGSASNRQAGLGTQGEDLLGEAEALDIIRVSNEHIFFRHPLLRAAVLNALPPDEKRSLHRAIAQVLDPILDADRTALHLGRSAQAPDRQAADALAAFAERARIRGAVSEAVTALERAAQLSDSKEHQAQHLFAAGQASYFSGDSKRGIAFAEQCLGLAESIALQAQANTLIANSSMWERSPKETSERLLNVASASKGEAPVLAGWALIGAASMAFLNGSLQLGVAQGREAETLGTHSGDLTITIAANAMVAWNLFLLGETTEATPRLQSLEPFIGALIDAETVEGVSFGQNWAMCLIMQERFAEAELLLERLLPIARRLAVDLGVAMVTVLLANLRWRQGRWREAYSHSTLYALSPDLPQISSAWGSAAAASMAAALGNADATQRFAQRAFASTPDGEVPLVRAWAHAALGHLYLSQNQPVVALAHLRQSAQHAAAMELGQPLFFLWWGDYLEALLGVGKGVGKGVGEGEDQGDGAGEAQVLEDEVRELLTQLEQQNERLHLAWIEGICKRTRGMLASSTEEADNCFKQSVHVLEAYPFEVARTKLAWAQKRMVNVDNASTLPTTQTDHTQKDSSTSEILHEAIQEFQRLQAATWEASAKRLATSLHQPNLEPSGLGTTQRQLQHEQLFVSMDSSGLEVGASDLASVTGVAGATQPESPMPSARIEETLSEAELRVALIVAAGRSNREVATDLYISVRTVEFHLGSIFRKLSLKNRNGVINFFVDNRPHS